MKDENKTKKQLISELKELRQQVSSLKETASRHERLEEALQKSEAKCRELVQGANSIILRMDIEGNITFFNKFAQNFFGYSASKIIGRNVVGTIVPEIDSSGRNLVTMIKDIGNHPELYKNNENENMCSNGKRVWVSWTNKGIHDQNGNLSEILCIGNDITDHKRAEEELKEIKAFLENILENSWDPILVTDSKGYIVKFNKSFLQMLGYESEEIMGKHSNILAPTMGERYESTIGELIEINEEFLNNLRELMYLLFKEGKIVDREAFLLRKDRKIVHAEYSIVALYDSGEHIIGSVGIIRDVTEKKKAEREIKEARDFLENVINTSADGIVVTDKDSYITLINDATSLILGYSRDRLIGRHIDEFIPKGEKHRKRVDELISRVLEKDFVTGFERSWLKKDGSLIEVESNVAILKDEKGNIIGSVGSIRDISERKQAEKKLIEYQNRLRSLASQLTLTEEQNRRYLANYLHDHVGQALFISKLKLGTIKSQISSTEMAESLKEVVDIIEQTIKDTRSLTFELSPPILYQFGLEAALEWLVDQMKKQYGMAIHFENDKKAKPLEESVLILLFQAVRELLINVTKHAKAQKVKVVSCKYDEKIKITVEDDGIGFTVSNNGSSNYRNDGFGLFSIEERLDGLGGNLEIESEPGRGTCITITAPLKKVRNSNKSISRQ